MKRSLSMLLAAATAFSAFPALTVSAEEAGAVPPDEEYHATGELEPEFKVPEWVPKDFNEALIFQNTYGATHIEGDVICFVRMEETGEEYSYDFCYSAGDLPLVEEPPCVIESVNTYEFEAPAAPNENDKEAYQAYMELCSQIGWSDREAEFMGVEPGKYDCGFRYTVFAFKLLKPVEMSMVSTTQYHAGNIFRNYENVYTFAPTTAANEFYETDIYGWLPDCLAEYEAFVKENGTISQISAAQGEFIAFAHDVCYDGGFDLYFDQSGTGLTEEYYASGYSDVRIMQVCGGQGHALRLYRPVRPGTVSMNWTITQGFSPNDPGKEIFSADYAISDDYQMTPIEPEAFVQQIYGDCSGNGEFGVEDIVAMEKYLTGAGEIACWQNVDFNNDARIDAADLTIFKQLYLEYLARKGGASLYEEPMTLTTESAEKRFGGKTEFTLKLSTKLTAENKISRIRLFERDGAEDVLGTFKQNEDGTYTCSAELNVTEDGTHFYFAYAELDTAEGGRGYLRSNEVAITFSAETAV
jgi:hypothetical protein